MIVIPEKDDRFLYQWVDGGASPSRFIGRIIGWEWSEDDNCYTPVVERFLKPYADGVDTLAGNYYISSEGYDPLAGDGE